jgi:hypothetical protein
MKSIVSKERIMVTNSLEISKETAYKAGKFIDKKLKEAALKNIDVYYGFNEVMVYASKEMHDINHRIKFPGLFITHPSTLDSMQPMLDDYCEKIICQYGEYIDSCCLGCLPPGTEIEASSNSIVYMENGEIKRWGEKRWAPGLN